MSNVLWNVQYAPSQAEDGKFVAVDNTTLLNYPATGWGKFALLTYAVNNISSTSWISTSSFGATTVLNPTPPTSLKKIEIQNFTGGNVYFLASSTNYANTSAKGILIANNAYYTLETGVSAISIASVAGGDVRIIGYY